jgi:exodeoxyribonuclease V beta subunit
MRLFYVGATRAKHRTIMWWAPANGSETSSLSHVLFDRADDATPLGTVPELVRGAKGAPNPVMPRHLPEQAEVDAGLAALVARSNGLIAVAPCPSKPSGPKPRWTGTVSKNTEVPLAIARTGGRSVDDPTWRRWSFTGITSTKEHVYVAPVRGGTDEPTDDGEGDRAVVDMPWARVLAGASFGTLAHKVMELVDPTSSTLHDDLERLVAAQLQRDRLDVDPAVLVAGLEAAILTPLGPIADGRHLADIGVLDRLAELDFDLPLVDTRTRFAARRIGEVLTATLSADDPMADYAASLASGRFDIDVSGFLQGSIDALLRVTSADGTPRFIVVDYKTNRVHARDAVAPLDAYRPDLLVSAMVAHDYPLQALLYSVAVHRFLGRRVAGYDPAVHLGGIAYLFLRGMVGPSVPLHQGAPYGVFAWRPPVAAVVGLDELFVSGGAR